MIQSFDWIIKANKDPAIRKTIMRCMETGDHTITIDRFTIEFSKNSEIATVRKQSGYVYMASKIISVEIPYRILSDMLDGNWDNCSDIRFLSE